VKAIVSLGIQNENLNQNHFGDNDSTEQTNLQGNNYQNVSLLRPNVLIQMYTFICER